MFEQLVLVDHPNIVKLHKYWLDTSEARARVSWAALPGRVGHGTAGQCCLPLWGLDLESACPPGHLHY